ncbi:MAG: hypothetical protein R3B93_19220 [Bacteroidia bacterium]
MRRSTIYKLIAVSIPFVIIIILEIILRFANYGAVLNSCFIEFVKDKPDYLVMNKDMAKKYFNDDDPKSDNQFDLFLKEKPTALSEFLYKVLLDSSRISLLGWFISPNAKAQVIPDLSGYEY